MTIKIPVEFKEVEIEKLSEEDIKNLFSLSDQLTQLNQYVTLQTFNKVPEEIISILSVSVECDEVKG